MLLYRQVANRFAAWYLVVLCVLFAWIIGSMFAVLEYEIKPESTHFFWLQTAFAATGVSAWLMLHRYQHLVNAYKVIKKTTKVSDHALLRMSDEQALKLFDAASAIVSTIIDFAREDDPGIAAMAKKDLRTLGRLLR